MAFTQLPGSTGSFPSIWIRGRIGRQRERQPYVFFASYNAEGSGLYDKYGHSDCLTPSALLPYFSHVERATTVPEPQHVQIISAGKTARSAPAAELEPGPARRTPNGSATINPTSPRHLLGVAP